MSSSATPFQLEASAKAPCTSTMVGLSADVELASMRNTFEWMQCDCAASPGDVEVGRLPDHREPDHPSGMPTNSVNILRPGGVCDLDPGHGDVGTAALDEKQRF